MKRYLSLPLIMLGLPLLAFAQDQPVATSDKPKPSVETKADARLWGALIFATEKKEHRKADYSDAKGRLATQLELVFKKYKHFQVLGEASEELFKAYGSWIVPSKEFFLKFDSKGASKDGGILLDLQLWREKEAIVKTDAILKADSPVFIEGPGWGKGRLIFVVQLQNDKKK